MPGEVTAYRVDIAQAELDDLRERLRRTRWPDPETVSDWSQGVPQDYLRDLCRYWERDYDWHATQRRINAVPQFRTTLGGLGVHFLHARSAHPQALPLLLTHGWPGSVLEFLDVVGALVDPPDPADAFHVVAPSLPGFGFSDRPTEAGWGVTRIAQSWAALMARLGYHRYGAHGGDWGSMITAELGRLDAAHLAGIHVTMPLADPDPDTVAGLSARERADLAATTEFRTTGSGYARLQSTRPQTLGYGLTDSPAGQCAWIVEKFQAWTDCDGHPENAIARDRLLDAVMLYWLPRTAASSARLYWESHGRHRHQPVHVPAGYSMFPREIIRLPRRWLARRFTDLRRHTAPDRGGHFPALEQPAVFVDELRGFFRLVR